MKKVSLLLFLFIAVLSATIDAKKPVEGVVNSITESEFKELISDYENGFSNWKFNGTRPAIIDFYANWCGPCRQIAPHFDALAKKYKGKIDFYKINVDECPNLAKSFNVSSIPMVLFVPAASSPDYVVGAYSQDEYEQVINYMFK